MLISAVKLTQKILHILAGSVRFSDKKSWNGAF